MPVPPVVLEISREMCSGSLSSFPVTIQGRLVRAVDELIDLPAPVPAVPKPAAATKATPKDLPTGSIYNLPKDYGVVGGKRTGKRGFQAQIIYYPETTKEKAKPLFRIYFERSSTSGTPEYIITDITQPGSASDIIKFYKKSPKGENYAALYEEALDVINSMHPEGFSK